MMTRMTLLRYCAILMSALLALNWSTRQRYSCPPGIEICRLHRQRVATQRQKEQRVHTERAREAATARAEAARVEAMARAEAARARETREKEQRALERESFGEFMRLRTGKPSPEMIAVRQEARKEQARAARQGRYFCSSLFNIWRCDIDCFLFRALSYL